MFCTSFLYYIIYYLFYFCNTFFKKIYFLLLTIYFK